MLEILKVLGEGGSLLPQVLDSLLVLCDPFLEQSGLLLGCDIFPELLLELIVLLLELVKLLPHIFHIL